jgi:hypothetical protein
MEADIAREVARWHSLSGSAVGPGGPEDLAYGLACSLGSVACIIVTSDSPPDLARRCSSSLGARRHGSFPSDSVF